MEWPALLGISARRLGAALVLGCGGLLACASNLWAQSPDVSENNLPSVVERLRAQEAEIAALREEVARHASELHRLPPVEAEEYFVPAGDAPTDGQLEVQPLVAGLAPAEALRISALEKKLDDLAKQAAAKPDAGDKKSDGAWIDVSGEKWTVKLGGHVQTDFVTWATASPAIVGDTNYFEFRRLRLVADGTGYGLYDFRLQMTLEPETVGETQPLGTASSPDVKDAYLSMNEVPFLGRIRIGNFFVPFSLEQVTNDTNNIFLERSIPSQGIFAADREVGVAFYNRTDDQNITWTGGFFIDSISDTLKERIDDNQGFRLSGRVTWLPFYDEPSNGRYLIHTGLGILHTDDQDDRVRFRARPQVREGPRLIDSGSLVAETYTTGNAELAIVWANFTLQSEAFVSSVDLTAAGPTTIGGAYAHVSYFLTGENRIFERFGQHGAQFGRNNPYTNFFVVPGAIGSGAWEAKARWSYLNLDNVNRGQYNDLTLGFNWYWSDRTRIMFDWIHPFTTADTVFGATQADLLAMRFDFNW